MTISNDEPATLRPELNTGRGFRWLVVLLIAGLLYAYSNTFSSPFVFDDEPSIIENKSITHLAKLDEALVPPPGATMEGRPVANLTFAVNYAIGGLKVRSYHVVNLAIHASAGLLLLGIVRRTLRRDGRYSGREDGMAWVVAGLWLLHPLQTESVTYVVQRVESLMGFWYMLTLYAFIRSCENDTRKSLWSSIWVGACWLGMGTKEVMVSAPLLVLLYDRTVVAGSFAEAWKRRRILYVAVFASWGFLGWLLSSSFDRNQTAGFGAGVSSWTYLLTQCRAIVTYLRLSLWPAGLTFDYGRVLVKDMWGVVPQAVLLIGLLLGTVWAVVRRSLLGVAGAWFFATLAPSSSIVPVVTQTMTEHRMYLALAAVVVVAVAVVQRMAARTGVICLGLAVPLFAVLTHQRNELYRDPISLWQDTVNKLPGSARARSNLGYLLALDGRPEQALPHFEAALLKGDYVDWELYANYAYALNACGRLDEAETQLTHAFNLDPHNHKVFAQRGNIAMKRGQMREATGFFIQAITYAPHYVTARINLGAAYVNLGEIEKAGEQYSEALRIDENCSRAWVGLSVIAFTAGRLSEAEMLCRRALIVASATDEADARGRLGEILAAEQRLADAEGEFVRVLELRPKRSEVRQNLASLLAGQGRYAEAIRQYEQVRHEIPPDAGLLGNLGLAFELNGQTERAVACYREAIKLDARHPFAAERLAGIVGGKSR